MTDEWIVSLGDWLRSQDWATYAEWLSARERLPITGGLGAAAAGALVSHVVQHRRARVFPVLFSQFSSLGAANITEAVDFYAAVNDMAMTVTQAWNNARATSDYSRMAQALGGSQLFSTTRRVERAGGALLSRLEPCGALAAGARDCAAAFERSWSYTSNNNYRLEPYLDNEVDERTKAQRQTLKFRQVYESTDHYFIFHRQEAQRAQELLETLLDQFPSDQLYTPGCAGLEVLCDSHSRRLIGQTILETDAPVDEAQCAYYMNQWLRSARAETALSSVRNALDKLRDEAPDALELVSSSPPQYHFNTASTSSDGPSEYRASQMLMSTVSSIAGEIVALEDSTQQCMAHAAKLREAVEREHSSPSHRSRRFAKVALSHAVEAYKAAFPHSAIHIDQRVAGGLTAAVAASAGIATGVLLYLLDL